MFWELVCVSVHVPTHGLLAPHRRPLCSPNADGFCICGSSFIAVASHHFPLALEPPSTEFALAQ